MPPRQKTPSAKPQKKGGACCFGRPATASPQKERPEDASAKLSKHSEAQQKSGVTQGGSKEKGEQVMKSRGGVELSGTVVWSNLNLQTGTSSHPGIIPSLLGYHICR